MKTLTQQDLHTALAYDSDTGVFTWKKPTSNRVRVGDIATCLNNHGYLRIGLFGKRYQAHRLAWFYVHGVWPTNEIDHINRDRTDNRIANLREATRTENALNVGAHQLNSSGIKGVSWDKLCKRWRVQIRTGGKTKYVGVYKTKEEAAIAYEIVVVTYRS